MFLRVRIAAELGSIEKKIMTAISQSSSMQDITSARMVPGLRIVASCSDSVHLRSISTNSWKYNFETLPGIYQHRCVTRHNVIKKAYSEGEKSPHANSMACLYPASANGSPSSLNGGANALSISSFFAALVNTPLGLLNSLNPSIP